MADSGPLAKSCEILRSTLRSQGKPSDVRLQMAAKVRVSKLPPCAARAFHICVQVCSLGPEIHTDDLEQIPGEQASCNSVGFWSVPMLHQGFWTTWATSRFLKLTFRQWCQKLRHSDRQEQERQHPMFVKHSTPQMKEATAQHYPSKTKRQLRVHTRMHYMHAHMSPVVLRCNRLV